MEAWQKSHQEFLCPHLVLVCHQFAVMSSLAELYPVVPWFHACIYIHTDADMFFPSCRRKLYQQCVWHASIYVNTHVQRCAGRWVHAVYVWKHALECVWSLTPCQLCHGSILRHWVQGTSLLWKQGFVYNFITPLRGRLVPWTISDGRITGQEK